MLDADADGQQIAAVWIAKEHLRDLLALRATRTPRHPRAQRGPRQARQLLHLVRRQRHHPRDKTLAKTMSKWQQPVIDAVLTGYSNDLASHCTSC